MNYHQHFDHLGNPLYRPAAKADLQHRIIRWASVATCLVSVGILVWGR